MPALNYIWIGPPQLRSGGHDVCGPVSVAMNVKKFSSTNTIVFWCQGDYVRIYEEYFAGKILDIKVSSIDQYLRDYVSGTTGDCRSEAREVLRQYKKRVLENTNAKAFEYVTMKNLFFNFILATQGGYVLDTNIQAQGDRTVCFIEHNKFRYPLLNQEDPEVWMQYAPASNLTQPKICLKAYIGYLIKSESEKKPSDYLRGKAVDALMRHTSFMSEPWKMTWDQGLDVNITSMNIFKEYYNTHVASAALMYPQVHAHVHARKMDRLMRDLEYGLSVDQAANTKNADIYNLELQNETLLNLALRLLTDREEGSLYAEYVIFLLKKRADPNIITTLLSDQKQTQDTALTLAIKAGNVVIVDRSVSAVQLLFENAIIPVQVDQVLNNESPLMLAVKCNNIDAINLLLKHNADLNQEWPDQISKPLSMASDKPAILSLLQPSVIIKFATLKQSVEEIKTCDSGSTVTPQLTPHG